MIFSKRERVAIIFLAILFLGTFTLSGLGFFNIFPYFDIVTHFLGGLFLALFFVDYFKKSLVAERRLSGDTIIIVGASLIVGVFWEIFEFLLTISQDYTNILFKMGDLPDTLKDLFVDMAGAVTMFFLIRHRHHKSKMFN